MTLPPGTAQRLAAEQALFLAERACHYLPDETRPRRVGAPLYLPGGPTGVLLVHGLMAAPEEVREWAEDLNARGYTVYAPRLAGHGTSAVDLATRRMEDWLDSVDRGHALLAGVSDRVVIAGFSTGAALALAEAQRHPERYRAVVSVSAPLRFASRKASLAEAVQAANRLLSALGLERWRQDFVHNPADNPHINYLRCPVSGIVQIRRLMRRVNRDLPGLRLPVLVLHGDRDPKVDARGGRELFRRLGSASKRYREIGSARHGIVRGAVGREVFAETAVFLAGLRLSPVVPPDFGTDRLTVV
jgi:carboxylesterase